MMAAKTGYPAIADPGQVATSVHALPASLRHKLFRSAREPLLNGKSGINRAEPWPLKLLLLLQVTDTVDNHSKVLTAKG